MKILKTIGIVLLGLLAAAAIVSFFLPSHIHVERSIVINKDQQIVFDQVNNLQQWINWSYWDNIDPNMKSTFEGPESGKGARHNWKSTHKQVGNGSMTIVENDPPNSLMTELNFEGWGSSMGGWTFDKVEGGTKTTIYMDVDLPYTGRIMPGLMMDKFMGEDFNKTLNGLKKWAESQPDKPEISYTIEEVDVPASMALSQRINCSTADIGNVMGPTFGAIMDLIKKQGLTPSGPSFTIYHHYNKDSVDMEPGIPVDKAGKAAGEIHPLDLPATHAARLEYLGPYSQLGGAYEYMAKWMHEQNKTITGSPWETYMNDPMSEPDSTKWLTYIYYPIQ